MPGPWVTVPEIVPEGLKVMPLGRPPDVNVYPPAPPVAETGALYVAFWLAFGNCPGVVMSIS